MYITCNIKITEEGGLTIYDPNTPEIPASTQVRMKEDLSRACVFYMRELTQGEEVTLLAYPGVQMSDEDEFNSFEI